MLCDRCHHVQHVGLCGIDHVVQGIEIQCGCVTASPESTDKKALRQSDAEQQRRLGKLDPRRGGRFERKPPAL